MKTKTQELIMNYWNVHESIDPDISTEMLIQMTIDSMHMEGYKNIDAGHVCDALAEEADKIL